MIVLAASSGNRSAGSLAQLLTVIVLFILVVALAYAATRFVAHYNRSSASSFGNMELMEALRISPNQVVEIIRIGDRYIAIGVSKDQITKLGEWNKEELNFSENPGSAAGGMDFKASFHAILDRYGKKEDNVKSDE